MKVKITVDSGEWDVIWEDILTQEEVDLLNRINSKIQELSESPFPIGCRSCSIATIKVEEIEQQ